MTRGSNFILASVFVCLTASAGDTTSPSALAREIDNQGAKTVVRGLADADWDRVMSHVSSGDAAWIALAPKLAEGTDGAYSEDLGISLAFALPKNAGAVLLAIDPANGPVLGIGRVCSAPFIEGTVRDIPSYILRARKALLKVNDPRLQNAKNACLAELAK